MNISAAKATGMQTIESAHSAIPEPEAATHSLPFRTVLNEATSDVRAKTGGVREAAPKTPSAGKRGIPSSAVPGESSAIETDRIQPISDGMTPPVQPANGSLSGISEGSCSERTPEPALFSDSGSQTIAAAIPLPSLPPPRLSGEPATASPGESAGEVSTGTLFQLNSGASKSSLTAPHGLVETPAASEDAPVGAVSPEEADSPLPLVALQRPDSGEPAVFCTPPPEVKDETAMVRNPGGSAEITKGTPLIQSNQDPADPDVHPMAGLAEARPRANAPNAGIEAEAANNTGNRRAWEMPAPVRSGPSAEDASESISSGLGGVSANEIAELAAAYPITSFVRGTTGVRASGRVPEPSGASGGSGHDSRPEAALAFKVAPDPAPAESVSTPGTGAGHADAKSQMAPPAVARESMRPLPDGESAHNGSVSAEHPAQVQISIGTTTAHEGRVRAELRAVDAVAARTPEMTTQLADQIRLQIQNGSGQVRIQLKPEYLGNLEIRAESGTNGIVARIAAASESVRNYLEGNMQALHQSLQEQGLKVAQIDVVLQDAWDPGQSANQHPFHGQNHPGAKGESARESGASGNSQTVASQETMAAESIARRALNPNGTFHTIA